MLSRDENERLTRVGPGTPTGTLLRRYWFPIAASADLDANPVKGIKLLGEDLVLFRDRRGRLGLISERCPHRRVSLRYGIPEADGLRCCYHGWMFDGQGRYDEYIRSRAAGRNAGGERMVERVIGHHLKIGFDVFAHGIVKRRVRLGASEDDPSWRIGHPILFPNILRVGWTFQFRVPMDDTHTYHVMYQVLPAPPGAEP